MALNSVFETKRRPSVRAASQDHASSFFSESQTSWVVFSPGEQILNDVLSFSTRSRLTDNEEDASIAHISGQALVSAAQADEDAALTSSRDSLSSRINAWQTAVDEPISDNVASWDLDADLGSHRVDTKLRHAHVQPVPDFYGSELLRGLLHEKQLQFHRSCARLRSSLTRRGCTQHPDIIARLLGLLRWQELLKTPGSLVDDYVATTLSRANLHGSLTRYERERSDTATSSSAVMCGGDNSWNDI